MVEAWQKRGSERQELLEKLRHQMYKEEERRRDPVFFFKVANTVLAYLQQRHHNAPRHDILQEATPLFDRAVFPAIHGFARSQAEEDALFFDFFEMVIDMIGHPFHAKLQEEELRDPQLIFGAPSSMSEVPLDRAI